MIHPLADIRSQKIGKSSRFWQFAIVLEGAKVGEDCNINCHTFIENDVVIGDRVTLKSGVYLWDGIRVENDVFIGPNATFVNDPLPRSKQFPNVFQQTHLRKGCSIGANATILGGLEIGEYALVGAGSVVTKSVPSNSLVVGNPARVVGWVNEKGERLQNKGEYLIDNDGNKFKIEKNKLIIL
jgi:acetyltransferase-like isoleucine patch superfamily enzyme